jgi:hypothetical protein
LIWRFLVVREYSIFKLIWRSFINDVFRSIWRSRIVLSFWVKDFELIKIWVRSFYLIRMNDIKFFSKKNFINWSFFNKHIDQIIEIKTQTIYVNSTQQKRCLYENDVKCDHIDKDIQIYDVDKKNFINVEFERNNSFFI